MGVRQLPLFHFEMPGIRLSIFEIVWTFTW
jgi:hypothetical protein